MIRWLISVLVQLLWNFYTLTAEDSEFQGFMAPGKGVYGASIKRGRWWGGYTTERKDGTSSATPIAAGVAALFIEYTRLNDLREAGNHGNMLKLFSAMSAKSGDIYKLLLPWTLLNVEEVRAALDTRKTEFKSCIIVESHDDRTISRTIKGSTGYLMILIVDTDSRVQILHENMDGTYYSLYILISRRAEKERPA
jgi:hypothetical protein